jgi:transposase
MGSIISKIKKGHKYYYFVESARVNGKPRIVKQVYLGTPENIVQAKKNTTSGIPNPDYAEVLEFGAVAALHELSERLEIRNIINEKVGKRLQGLPVGDSIVLAAINRAVGPVSKNQFYKDWFKKTVLPKSFPKANTKNLSSQGYWNNMSLIDSNIIRSIEDKITTNITKLYNISTNTVLFDNTNFITYIDTDTPSLLAKRGKSKEHRSDLRIVGLSLMVSPENNIPLFHEPYPGNTNDAKRFSEIIDSLKYRCQSIQDNPDITLVFDRGNNSSSNIERLVQSDPLSFHFVGGLKHNQCPELLDTPNNQYKLLVGDTFGETKAFRTTKEEFGREVTVVVTDNPELYKLQMRGVTSNIEKCSQELDELSYKIKEREDGKIFRGRQYSVDSVIKKIESILKPEHMNKIFDYKVEKIDGNITLSYNINEGKFSYLKQNILGKSILFTDRDDWSNERIVSAYRSQYHVEECFKQMKDTEYLSFVPIRHFTDKHITVHAFYCVLALTLASVLNLEFKRMGYEVSIHQMLKELSDVKQVINYYNIEDKKKITKTITFSKSEENFDNIIDNYINKYNLYNYAYK